MPANIVQDTVRNANRRAFIYGVLGILILLGVALLSYRFLANFVRGPVAISNQSLLAVKDPNALDQYYVTVEGDDSFDSGFQKTETKDGGPKTITASFVVLQLGRQYLLVQTPGDLKSDPETRYTGAVVELPTNVRNQVVPGVEKDLGRKGALLPFMLDTSDFRSGGYFGIGVGILIAALCLWLIGRAIVRSRDPMKHPIMRSLKRFGQPAEVAEQINREMANPHEKAGNVHLLPNWLVVSTGGSLDTTRFDDIAWLYGKVTQHRTNGIPTGKTYSTIIWDCHGKSLTVGGKEQAMADLLKTIVNRAPWAFAGYTAELEKAWRSNRAAVLSAVQQRRQQVATADPNRA
jgi:hypothetical protein